MENGKWISRTQSQQLPLYKSSGGGASTHMLRVGTTDELFQICIALVSQVLVNADRGSVIAINSQTLNSNKETFLDCVRPSLVPADRSEQRYLLFLARPSESCRKLQLAHPVNSRKTVTPQCL